VGLPRLKHARKGSPAQLLIVRPDKANAQATVRLAIGGTDQRFRSAAERRVAPRPREGEIHDVAYTNIVGLHRGRQPPVQDGVFHVGLALDDGQLRPVAEEVDDLPVAHDPVLVDGQGFERWIPADLQRGIVESLG
jgi:hypothetical protein